MNILVIDDQVDIADSLASLLRLQGHEAQACYGAKSALLLAEAMQPECVLVDFHMPQVNGEELARMLRERMGTSVVIIGITGDDEMAVATDPRLALMDHCLTKPVSAEQLKRLLPL